MSAQKTSQQSTSQSTSRGGQQTSLARRDVLPSLFRDPFGFFDENPFSLMRKMQDELNQVFSQTLARSTGGDGFTGAAWAPAVEIAYREGNLDVSAELPGLSEKDVKVEIENDVLTIQGERKIEEEKTEGGIRRSERRYGEFYRAIALPEGAKPDQARAEFKNGILHITIPVQEPQSNRREIPVQASAAQQQGQSAEQKPAESTGGQKAA